LMLLPMTRVPLLFACYKVTLAQIVFRSNTASAWNSMRILFFVMLLNSTLDQSQAVSFVLRG
jgi:hypothetical protein